MFDEKQLREIKLGKVKNVNTEIYAKPEYPDSQMAIIRHCLTLGYDVSVYAKQEYNSKQLRAIRYGIEYNFNYELYAKREFDAAQMMIML